MVPSGVRFTQKGGMKWVLFRSIFLGQKMAPSSCRLLIFLPPPVVARPLDA
jgi:hypothetical protein